MTNTGLWWICVSPCVTGSLPLCLLGFISTATNEEEKKKKQLPQSGTLLTYPKFAFEIEGIQQFDNVMVVTGGQNVNLYHVILQLILRLCVDNLGSSKGPILLVLSLKATWRTKEGNWSLSMGFNIFLISLAGLQKNQLGLLCWGECCEVAIVEEHPSTTTTSLKTKTTLKLDL